MVPADPALEESTARPDEDDERAFFRAIAECLADDAAGRVMSTEDLEAELERRLGPIAWRQSGRWTRTGRTWREAAGSSYRAEIRFVS